MIRVVGALIKNGDKILLAKRARGNLIGYWEFPGGKIENRESNKDAIVREIKEELGLNITPLQQSGVFEHNYSFGLIKLYLIECSLSKENIILDGSHSQTSWFSIKEIQKIKLAPLDKKIVKTLINESKIL